MEEYDLIVIGRGPAGITSAIYAKRGNLNVLVIGKDKGLMESIGEVENYYAAGKTTGNEIQQNGENHAKELGIEILEDEVLRIEYKEDGYIIKTINGEYKSQFVFLGIGVKRKVLNIENIKSFEGRGVSYCAVCDGFFYKDKTIAVYGNSEYSIEETEMLSNTVSKIYLLTNGNEPINLLKELVEKDNNRFEIVSDKVLKVLGEEKIEKIELEDGKFLDIDGLFIAEEANNKSFAMQLGILMDGELIVVDENRKTNVDGIYAGGDVTPGIKQITRASNDGMLAALDIIKQNNIRKFVKK